MKILIITFLFLFSGNSFAQKKYEIVEIDSTNNFYVIKIKKLNTEKVTTLYSVKSNNLSDEKIKVGNVYVFTFCERYRIGTPNLRYDNEGNEKFAFKKIAFKKNNKDTNYTAFELNGLNYIEVPTN